MKKGIFLLVVLLLCATCLFSALAYPTIGVDSLITETRSFPSGFFLNYHFPNRYIRGDGSFSISFTGTSHPNTPITIKTHNRRVDLTNSWQSGSYSNVSSSMITPPIFSSSSTHYYCYELTKDSAAYPYEIHITYTLIP